MSLKVAPSLDAHDEEVPEPPAVEDVSPPNKKKSVLDDSSREGERTISFTEDGDAKIFPDRLNKIRGGRPNLVSTTKFTLLTWLPLSLYWQFQRIANIYFLFVSCIVLFDFSPKNWKSKVLPFGGVLMWTALKDLVEDYRRKYDDDRENSRTCMRYEAAGCQFSWAQWSDIVVGDILWVPCDEAFPADLCLLQADGGHESFISTLNLDGETNLKDRRSPDLLGKLYGNWHRRRSPNALSTKDNVDGSSEPTFLGIVSNSMISEPSNASRSSREKELASQMNDDDLPVRRSSSGRNSKLKDRREVASLVDLMHKHGLKVIMGAPEPGLSDVRGMLELGGETTHINERNFLPRGCVLRNTVWALALVVYAGDETKTKLNAVKSSAKVSNMQVYLNKLVQGLLICLFINNAICAFLAVVVHGDPDPIVIKFLIFCITLYHVVPISLYVCFEMLKLVLGMQLNMDPQMVDPETGQGAVARTADLMEELGQVDFIFSDKTGTLTVNEMMFARCSVAGVDLGDFRPTCNDGIKEVMRILSLPTDSKYHAVERFFTCLAICHAVQTEICEEEFIANGRSYAAGDYVYSGMSPDEVALVQAAHDVGIVFKERMRRQSLGTSDVLIQYVADPGLLKKYEILYELEFNSDRKRMSVIARHDDEILCITKGADNVMADLMDRPLDEKCIWHLNIFSKEGLRTLVVGQKKVPPDEFQSWEAEMRAATSIVDNTRKERIFEVAAKMEVGLTYVGVTAVEDRLQEGAPECIAAVKLAGVRVWVLTGDKTETAVDTARSCKLFDQNTKLAYAVDAKTVDDVRQQLQEAVHLLTHTSEEGGLVLDGTTVSLALEDEVASNLIYDLGLACRCCVCCRLSPMQKRRLVELVRHRSPTTITLAIGDGANDVPMLEGAHVGIGIRGKEGSQAVQVSDIAVSQFRYLQPLLLCHGRRAYRRVAFFLCYYIYKNVGLAVPDIVWSIQNGFTGTIAFPEYLAMGYNACFTSWHILFVLGFDVDVADNLALANPQLYLDGPNRIHFNYRVFMKWMVYAVWHGCVAWILPFIWIGSTSYETGGMFWVSSCTAFTLVVFIVDLRLIVSAESPMQPSCFLPSLVALLLFFLWTYCLGETSFGHSMQETFVDVPFKMLDSKGAKACLFLGPAVALFPDVAEKFFRNMFYPTQLLMLKKQTYLAMLT